MIEALQQEELYAEDEESGALDIAWTLNGEKDYSYYLFDQQVVEDILVQYDASQVDDSKAYWALDKMIPVCYVGDATYQLVRPVSYTHLYMNIRLSGRILRFLPLRPSDLCLRQSPA